MLRTCESRLHEGSSLCVFREGTRSNDGEIQRFFRGASWIAARNRVPMVPMVVDGTGAILPKGSLTVSPQPVRVRVLEPIFPEQFGFDDRRLRDAVFERMSAELAALRADQRVSVRGMAQELG